LQFPLQLVTDCALLTCPVYWLTDPTMEEVEVVRLADPCPTGGMAPVTLGQKLAVEGTANMGRLHYSDKASVSTRFF